MFKRGCSFSSRYHLFIKPLPLYRYSTIKNNEKANVSKPSASASWNLKLPVVGSREILKELWPLVWPKGDWRSRVKVCTAVSLLLGGKV